MGDASHISSGLGGHIGRTSGSLMVRRVASLGPVADGWCVAIHGVGGCPGCAPFRSVCVLQYVYQLRLPQIVCVE